MQKLNIKDNSGDKKYFTIIPNFILNHSTMWDREVYVQMKRITGEEGTCYASRATLAKQCGMSIRRLDKSIKYLTDHKWIKLIGIKSFMTKGGEQSVNEYEISDLWKMNVDYYENQKGSAPDAHPIDERVCTDDSEGYAHSAGGVVHMVHTKKNQREEEQEKKREIATLSPTPKEISLNFFSKESEREDIIYALVENGMPENVARAEIGKFVNYWTELNQTGKKKRWEQEKTFEVKRRLTTWFSRVNQFNGFDSKKSKLAWMPTK